MQQTQEIGSQSLGWKDPWSRKWQPTPVFLPGKSHGQRSLAGDSPQGHKESDTAEHTHPMLSSSCGFCGGFLTRSSPVAEILLVFLQASTSFVSPVL